VGRVTSDPDDHQQARDEYQNNDAFNECGHICILIVFGYHAYQLMDLAIERPLSLVLSKLLPFSHLALKAPRVCPGGPDSFVQIARPQFRRSGNLHGLNCNKAKAGAFDGHSELNVEVSKAEELTVQSSFQCNRRYTRLPLEVVPCNDSVILYASTLPVWRRYALTFWARSTARILIASGA